MKTGWGLTFLLLVVAVPAVGGEVPGIEPYPLGWVRQFGGDQPDYGLSVAVDKDGSAFITGYTWGTLRPPSAGMNDAFLTKYDVSGNLLWIRQFGTNRDDVGYSVAADASGNAVVAGRTYGSLYGSLSSNIPANILIAKYDGLGDPLWIRAYGTSAYDIGYGVVGDASGCIYVTGYTGGRLGNTSIGGGDAFVAKFDGTGEPLWIRQFGTSQYDCAYALALDGAGSLYVAGNTEGDFDGPVQGPSDATLAKFDASGNLLWKRQLGTDGFESGHSVTADAVGNVYMTGLVVPDSGLPEWAENRDLFLAKYNAQGNLLWTRRFDSDDHDDGLSVAADARGNVYVCGEAGADALLSKYDPSGRLLWAECLGTAAQDDGCSVALDAVGMPYVAGRTLGAYGGPQAGGGDVFVARSVPEPTCLVLLPIAVCLPLIRRRT